MSNDIVISMDAEQFRRRRCDNRGDGKSKEHKCIGVITLKPGICMLDCELCGTDAIDLRPAMRILDGKEDDE